MEFGFSTVLLSHFVNEQQIYEYLSAMQVK